MKVRIRFAAEPDELPRKQYRLVAERIAAVLALRRQGAGQAHMKGALAKAQRPKIGPREET